MISQHWFSLWLGAIRQQAITWANVDPDLCRQMASLGLSELPDVLSDIVLTVCRMYYCIRQFVFVNKHLHARSWGIKCKDISNYIPLYCCGGNELSMPKISASGRLIIFIKNVVAVAAYSRLASRSQAKFHTKKLSPLVRPCAFL